MIQKVADLTEEPVVGKFYLVECVTTTTDGTAFIPVAGVEHSDPDLKVAQIHLHRDPRFMSDRYLSRFGYAGRRLSNLHAIDSAGELAAIILVDFIVKRKLLRRRCYRKMPVFPDIRRLESFPKSSPIWTEFHNNYIGRKALCGRCPHKGMPLESLPQDKDGNVICNGHGLKVNLKQGVVVER